MDTRDLSDCWCVRPVCGTMRLSNTVSPMQVTLPGEPMTPEQRSAQAQVDLITGAYILAIRAQTSCVEAEIDDLPWEAQAALAECLWNVGDGNYALRDAAEEYAREQAAPAISNPTPLEREALHWHAQIVAA